MTRDVLSHDTPLEVEERQIQAWQAMTPAEKIALVLQMSATVRELAIAGIRQRHPGATAQEQQWRLAQVLFGDELAKAVHRDLEALDPS